MMTKHASIGGNTVFFLEDSMWIGIGKDQPHPWDLDCIWEQLQAREWGLT